MQKGFWSKLNKPVFALAPMADVTDASFRFVIAKYGKPDVMWTEFVSADALCSVGREHAMRNLSYDKSERPIVAQIFGAHRENFLKASKILEELGFDGIDINMGCPEKNIVRQGGGSALFKKPELAKEIIRAAQEGAGKIPVSVKIRIGDAKIELEGWLKNLLEAEPAAITVHLRTRSEMSKVPAHWELMPEIMRIVKEACPDEKKRPVILGNGDVQTIAEAKEKIEQTGCDGVMIGRGIFGNPWRFNKTVDPETVTLEQKLDALLEHTYLYEKMFKGIKSFELMKKHYKAYVAGFDGAKEIRMEMMACRDADQVAAVVRKHFPAVVK